MSHIIVQMGIDGEETLTDYADGIRCRAMQHGIDMPVVANTADRTEGASVHGSILLEHEVDKASPILREYCAKGTSNVPTVTITRIKLVGTEGGTRGRDQARDGEESCPCLSTRPPTIRGGPTDMPIETDSRSTTRRSSGSTRSTTMAQVSDTIAGSYDTDQLSTTVRHHVTEPVRRR